MDESHTLKLRYLQTTLSALRKMHDRATKLSLAPFNLAGLENDLPLIGAYRKAMEGYKGAEQMQTDIYTALTAFQSMDRAPDLRDYLIDSTLQHIEPAIRNLLAHGHTSHMIEETFYAEVADLARRTEDRLTQEKIANFNHVAREGVAFADQELAPLTVNMNRIFTSSKAR